jgi:B12-binding domain/radical SAM domain protein
MELLRSDLILLHAPSVYDFRKKAILYGPISDVIPSSPIFEMYPIGFSSLLEYLHQRGMRVRIINLAYLMLTQTNFDAEQLIRKLKCATFGIDLHWLPHAQGSLEIAAICKRLHPDRPVIMGGYSASYFHRELINYPQVNFVLRGDSAEKPLFDLLRAIKQGSSDYSRIPNLTWKDGNAVRENDLSCVAADLDTFSNNYLSIFKCALLSADFKGFTSIRDWWEYPITAIMTCRGCVHNCVFCGGGRAGIKDYCKRERPAFRPPQLLAHDIYTISRYTNGPIFVVGDLRQSGDEIAYEVLDRLQQYKISNPIVLELFKPADKTFFSAVARAVSHCNFEFSPESHLETVRRYSGKLYSNAEIEETISAALESGCKKFDLFFMIGLPHQTPENALASVDYCRHLLQRFGNRLNPFISPLAPFIDPGSLAYEQSEKFGYKIFYRTLEEFRKALLQPSWKYTLGYETEWMTREEIVATTYESALRLNRVKQECGLIDPERAGKIEERIHGAVKMMERIDEILKIADCTRREEELLLLKPAIDTLSIATICAEDEIKWPAGKRRFNYFTIIKDMIFGSRKVPGQETPP